MADSDDKREIVHSWHAAFKRGTDFDMWGQPVEAVDSYQRLAKQLAHYSSKSDPTFSDSQKKVLDKIAICLESRCKVLQNSRDAFEGISLDNIRKLELTLKNLLVEQHQPGEQFPVDVSAARLHSQPLPNASPLSACLDDDVRQESRVRGNLLPRPLLIPGMTLLSVRVEKIGLVDAGQYLDPFISVSVRDSVGKNLTVVQDTPIASYKEDTCIPFSVDVHIQKTIESLPPGFAIFFEFKHYKPKKKYVSTKCWTFMEKDEIKEGSISLELYKKPTDYKRKSIHLLTVKPLFLHLKLLLYT